MYKFYYQLSIFLYVTFGLILQGCKTSVAEPKPQLIILDGLSTAGKTTTANEFIKGHSNCILLQRSERQRELLYSMLAKEVQIEGKYGPTMFCFANYRNCPGFKTYFADMLTAISNTYDLETIDMFMQKHRDTVLEIEEKEAAQEAAKHLSNGRTVFLDNLIFKNNLSHFTHLSPQIVLVYCPFANILEHIKLRNQEAVEHKRPEKWRNPYKVYASFIHLFGPVNKHNFVEALEIIDQPTIVNTLKKLFEYFPPEDFIVDSTSFQQDILQKLLCGKNEVEIFPQLTIPNLVLKAQGDVHENVASLSSHLATISCSK